MAVRAGVGVLGGNGVAVGSDVAVGVGVLVRTGVGVLVGGRGMAVGSDIGVGSVAAIRTGVGVLVGLGIADGNGVSVGCGLSLHADSKAAATRPSKPNDAARPAFDRKRGSVRVVTLSPGPRPGVPRPAIRPSPR